MGIVYQHDKRSGITYAYESKAHWDKEKKQSRAKRTLIGRLDEKAGEIVPTDGRVKKAQKRKAEEVDLKTLCKRLAERVDKLEDEVSDLKARIPKE